MVLPDRDDGDGYDIAIKSTENMNENRRFFLIAGIMQPPNETIAGIAPFSMSSTQDVCQIMRLLKTTR